MTGKPNLDREAWTEQFTALFDLALGNLPDDQDGELSVCAYVYNRERRTSTWKPLGTVPFQNNSDDLAWELIEPYAKTGSSIYFGVGIRRTGTSGQGKETDIIAHSTLGVDLDAADGVHAASDADSDRDDFSKVTEEQIVAWKTSDGAKTRPLPRATRAEADGWTPAQLDLWLSHKGTLPLPTTNEIDAWIKEMPVEPTLVTETGGGFHVYVTLTHPVDIQHDMVGKRVRAGWIAHWLKIGYESRRQVDPGPLKNAAGVLRMAGTPNHKLDEIGHIVLIDEHNEGTSYSHEEMIEAFTMSDIDIERVKTLTQTSSGNATRGMVMNIANPKEHPVDLSDREFPMDRFTDEMPLAEVGALVGIKWSGSTARVGWLDADGDYEYNKHTTNASVFEGEDETLLKLWGPGTTAQWQDTLDTDRTTHTAAQVLELALVRLGVKKAFAAGATLANRYRTIKNGRANYGTLIADLLDAENADDVQALIDAKPVASSTKSRKALPAEPAPTAVVILDQNSDDEPGTDVVPVTVKAIDHTEGLARTSTRPFRDALADPRGEEYVVKMERAGKGEENAFVVRVSTDPSKHGLFKRILRTFSNEDGADVEKVYYTQVTDFILFIDAINASRHVTGMGSVEVTGKDFTTVTVALSDGRFHTTRPLDTTQSRSPTTVVRELSTFTILSEPYDEGETRAFKAMIVEMGKHAVVRQTVLNKIDWYSDDTTGRLMYVTPTGALWIDPATGKPAINPNIISAESAKNSKLRGTEWQTAFGFDKIATPEEVASQMPQMIADYCGLLPKKPEIAQALLGSFFLSFLPGGNRSACILVGVGGTMKSSLVKHLALLVADHRPFGVGVQPFSVNIDTESEASARTSTNFQGTAPNFCEDFLTSNNPSAKDMERRLTILEEVTTSSFSGAGAGRGAGTDERADRKVVMSTPFITAETLTAGETRIGRAITLPINRGDISLEASKAFHARWIESGIGRSIFAGWLAAIIADFDSAATLANAVNSKRTELNSQTTEINSGVKNAQIGRMSSNATQVLAGLAFLTKYTPGADWSTKGAEWVTMNDADMDTIVSFLRDDNVSRVLDANPAHKIIGAIASGIGSKKLYLMNYAGGVPAVPDRYGWVGNDLGGKVDWDKGNAMLAGRISRDGTRIYLNLAALDFAKRSAGVMGRGNAEIMEKLAEYVSEGTVPGEMLQSKEYMVDSNGSRYPQRTITVDATTLGLEVDLDGEPDSTLPTAAGAVKSRQDEAAFSDF